MDFRLVFSSIFLPSGRLFCSKSMYGKISSFFGLMSAAARTKNYSGAELEGVAKSAVSYALNRQLSMDDLHFILDLLYSLKS